MINRVSFQCPVKGLPIDKLKVTNLSDTPLEVIRLTMGLWVIVEGNPGEYTSIRSPRLVEPQSTIEIELFQITSAYDVEVSLDDSVGLPLEVSVGSPISIEWIAAPQWRVAVQRTRFFFERASGSAKVSLAAAAISTAGAVVSLLAALGLL